MKDETRITSNSLISFVAQGVSAMVSIALVPFLLINLGEKSYGVVGVIGSTLALMTLIDLGLRPAIARQFTRFLFEGDVRRSNEVASCAMASYLMLVLLLLVATGIGREPFLVLFGVDPILLKDASQALFLIVLSLGFTLIYTPYRAALVSQLRHDVDHYTKIITVPLRAGIVVTCFALIEPSLRLWAIAWLVSAILAFGFQRFQAHRHCPSLEVKKRWVTRRGFRDLAGFGVYTSVAQLSNLLDRSSGPLIISYFLGTAAVAHYMPALIIVVAMQSLSGAFIMQLNPVVTKAHARSDYAQISSILIRSTRYSLLLSGGAAVGIGAFAFTLIPLWLGEGFRDTAIALVIWCVATVLRASVGGALPIFLGTGKLRAVTPLNAALVATGVGASIYFVGFTDFGVVGATFGVLVTQVARTAVYIFTAMRIAGVGLSQYFRESYQGPLLCLALAAATSLGTQAALGSNAWIKLAAGGGLSLLVFAILAWTVGLNARDRRKALDYGRIAVNWARSAFS